MQGQQTRAERFSSKRPNEVPAKDGQLRSSTAYEDMKRDGTKTRRQTMRSGRQSEPTGLALPLGVRLQRLRRCGRGQNPASTHIPAKTVDSQR